jgi:hypothetical protein
MNQHLSHHRSALLKLPGRVLALLGAYPYYLKQPVLDIRLIRIDIRFTVSFPEHTDYT